MLAPSATWAPSAMLASLAGVMLLSACAATPKVTPQDPALTRLHHAGDIAFDLDRPDQAAEQYRAELAHARTRDDAAAIADAGFNLATAELTAGHPAQAMQTTTDLQSELGRRGIVDPDFNLVAATALFRMDDLPAADRTAAAVTAGRDPALTNPAWFLRGLIADRQGDRSSLTRAAASLTATADPADIAELQARLTHDRALALRSADLRRDRLDYRGMARGLALAAQTTPDPRIAADLYLRAGRSAAAQGDVQQARIWLTKAGDLTADATVRSTAQRALHDLPAP